MNCTASLPGRVGEITALPWSMQTREEMKREFVEIISKLYPGMFFLKKEAQRRKERDSKTTQSTFLSARGEQTNRGIEGLP